MSIDTMRADRLGCYGRSDAGTPVMDELARRGVRFADVTASAPVTLPSHTTLLTGQSPARHGVRHNGLFALPARATTLAEVLRRNGYRTGGFVASVALAERHGLSQGFEAYTSPSPSGGAGTFFLAERPAREVNRDALHWLDTVGTAPFFLWVHYMEPHAPYDPPEPERSRYPQDPYQGEVSAADRVLGELLEGIEGRGRLDGTLVVLVSDHGEDLGDHGEMTHGVFLYQSCLRVPLILAGPGVHAGTVVSEPVGLVDVTPTVLEALDLPPLDPCDGESLWKVAQGMERPDPLRPLYAETFLPRYDYGWSELRALRVGAWKYIRAPRPELYSLEGGPPFEMRNRIGQDAARAETLSRQMDSVLERMEGAAGAAERLAPSAREKEALESLGYLSGSHVDVPARGPLPDPKDRLQEALDLDQAGGLLRRGEALRAEEILRRLLRENPTLFDARIRLLGALLLQGRIAEAVEEAKASVALARGLPDGDLLAAPIHVFLAESYAKDGRTEDEAREYELALAAPMPEEVHVALAGLYVELGRPADAVRVLRVLEARGDASERSREMLHRLTGDDVGRGSGPTGEAGASNAGR